MSQFDSKSFGTQPQHHAGNSLPSSDTASNVSGQSRETLSDVVGGGFFTPYLSMFVRLCETWITAGWLLSGTMYRG
jgi:hypothetical protein